MENFTHTKKDGVHVGGRRHVLPTQVMMLVADINYTTIFLDNGQRFMVATTIGKIQKSLQKHGNFVRTNKSQVVNWAYVRSSNSKELLLKNDEIVRFSRRRGHMRKNTISKS
jgi:two-component system LytT family response regulator